VRPKTLDHVALWVADRDSIADFATEHLGMHVIERTERFTLCLLYNLTLPTKA
jgi:catechol 2,3-dioxygenase-like lactoylglutathione lyase family enzyme